MIQHMHRVQEELKTQFKTQLGGNARRNSPVSWIIAVLLLILIFWLFIQLWVGNGTIPDIFFLNQDIKAQKLLNQALQKENEQRIEQIKSLKGGDEELEARARSEIGMLKPGEIFYEIPAAQAPQASQISPTQSQDKSQDKVPSQVQENPVQVQGKQTPVSSSIAI
jgi:cell division protein FtsB